MQEGWLGESQEARILMGGERHGDHLTPLCALVKQILNCCAPFIFLYETDALTVL